MKVDLNWKDQVSSPDKVMQKIKPGMRIFIGTGVSEPLTLVRYLKESDAGNLLDLELFQLVSLGEAIEINARHSNKYRLKTFFSGWEAREAVSDGFADFIPSRYYQIPAVFKSGQIPIDVAFIQITPPNEAGYCCLGVCADVALPAIEQASLVVGEINTQIPWTFGETFVPFSKFDMIVESTQPPIYFDRWKVDETYNRLGANAASLIDDGSCIGFSVGPLYESLGRHLKSKRDLSIHTPFFFDNLMDLVNSGAVTNRHNRVSPGKIPDILCHWHPQADALAGQKSAGGIQKHRSGIQSHSHQPQPQGRGCAAGPRDRLVKGELPCIPEKAMWAQGPAKWSIFSMAH